MADQDSSPSSMISFLSGANAHYLDALYADYCQNPSKVSPEVAEFFAAIEQDEKEEGATSSSSSSQQPSWQRQDWPPAEKGEMLSALDGNWDAIENHMAQKIAQKSKSSCIATSDEKIRKATRESVQATMMIRASGYLFCS